jgi:hypothetical protein
MKAPSFFIADRSPLEKSKSAHFNALARPGVDRRSRIFE